MGLMHALLMCLFAVGEGRRRGYAISFQGANSIAGIRNEIIDWEDPGMSDFGTSYTISGWFKFSPGKSYGAAFQMSAASYKSLIFEYFFAVFRTKERTTLCNYEKSPLQAGHMLHRRGDWHYITMVYKDGAVYNYLNGTLSGVCLLYQWGVIPEPFSFKQPGATFHLGSSFTSNHRAPINKFAQSNGARKESVYSGFTGKIDDFGIWPIALNGQDIQEYMRGKPPSDAAIFYNFDAIGCDGTDLYHHSCTFTGDHIIKNHGSAGNKYDLLVGRLNDKNEFGVYWEEHRPHESETPEKFLFTKPTVSLESAPVFESELDLAQIPTILQVRTGGILDIRVPFVWKTILEVPKIGRVLRGSDVADLNVGDDITNETVIQFAAGEQFSSPVILRISVVDTDGETSPHEVHVWPFLPPRLLKDNPRLLRKESHSGKAVTLLDLHTLERLPLLEALKYYAISPYGEEFRIQIVWFPDINNCHLYAVKEVQEVRQGRVVTVRYLDNMPDLTLYYHQSLTLGIFPVGNFTGYEYVKFIYLSATGQESEEVGIRVNVLSSDEIPSAKTELDLSVVSEDSVNGTEIELKGDDDKKRFGFYYAIDSLPRKGKLYKRLDGKWVEIVSEYNSFDQGSLPLQQYASAIRRVSSFWVSPILSIYQLLTNHPLWIIGPPSCNLREEQNYCDYTFYDDRDLPVGYIVSVDIYAAGPLKNAVQAGLWLPAKIISGPSSGVSEYTVEVLPTWKRSLTTGNMERCVTDRGLRGKEVLVFPDDCSEIIGKQFGNKSFIISSLARTSLREIEYRTWRPYSNSFFNDEVDGGDVSAAFGEKFRFKNNHNDFYFGERDPKYTEYVEVEFDTAVYPILVEVGSNSGGGAIVAVKALSPDDTWVSLYEESPQKSENKRARQLNRYFYFDELLCRQNFKVRVLRLELDTSRESGIGEPNFIDYIKLVGATEIQTATLGYNENKVLYVPNPNEFGDDSFEFRTWDCGGKLRRGSEVAVEPIEIIPEPDAPEAYFLESDTYILRCDNVSDFGNLKLSVSIIDRDNDAVSVVLRSYPEFGVIRDNGVSIHVLDTFQSVAEAGVGMYSLDFEFSVWNCSNESIGSGTFQLALEVLDARGDSTNITTNIRLLKQRRSIATTAKLFSWLFFGVNQLMCLLFLGWVIVNIQDPIVKAAQKQFLVLILIGASVSTFTIIPFTTDSGIDGSKKPLADNMCILMPWLYCNGFMLTFASLYAKLYKVSKLFEMNFALKVANCQSEKEKKRLKRGYSLRGQIRKLVCCWLVDMIICASWTFSDPMEFRMVPVRYDTVETDFVVESIGMCRSEHDITFISVIAAFHLVVLLMVAYYSYKTSHVNDAFSEARFLRVSIGSSLQILLFSLPIMVMTSDPHAPNIETMTFIRSGVVWLNDFSVLSFVFIPKIWMSQFGLNKGGEGYENLQHAIANEQLNKKKDASKDSSTKGQSSDSTKTTSNKILSNVISLLPGSNKVAPSKS